jgi:SPP1 family predicted phage head-tail adaptor
MSGGKLRERLRFESPTSVSDGLGGTTQGWSDEFSVAARAQPRVGGEVVLAERLHGRQAYLIYVRSSSQTRQIEPDWRAVDTRDETLVYQIKSPSRNMDEKGAYLEMDAMIGVAG